METKHIEDIIFEALSKQFKDDKNVKLIQGILNGAYGEAKSFGGFIFLQNLQKEELKFKTLYGINMLIYKNKSITTQEKKEIILKITEVFYNIGKDENKPLTELQKKAIMRQIYYQTH